MVLKAEQMTERNYENTEKNLIEMILVARAKRNNHLKLIHAANKKARREKRKI